MLGLRNDRRCGKVKNWAAWTWRLRTTMKFTIFWVQRIGSSKIFKCQWEDCINKERKNLMKCMACKDYILLTVKGRIYIWNYSSNFESWRPMGTVGRVGVWTKLWPYMPLSVSEEIICCLNFFILFLLISSLNHGMTKYFNSFSSTWKAECLVPQRPQHRCHLSELLKPQGQYRLHGTQNHKD